jgi:hypothetical protein
MFVMRLGVRSVDPITNVEQSIHSSQSYEAANKHLHASILLKHDELRKECKTVRTVVSRDERCPFVPPAFPFHSSTM